MWKFPVIMESSKALVCTLGQLTAEIETTVTETLKKSVLCSKRCLKVIYTWFLESISENVKTSLTYL